jgi:hypothetical protein
LTQTGGLGTLGCQPDCTFDTSECITIDPSP